ncbi:MAG: type II toxin-antitoxin system RelE/ParE family toxin [Candidatus Symbiobacter sp.]|nr:type II toxin-antitoxin system RelE/ParE family toxin [Candidatus Symbiobacter sp.]
MVWQIDFKPTAIEDFNGLDKAVKVRIDNFINNRLINHPNPYAISKPLVGKFQGLRRFRVGDYRLIAEINDNEKLITIHDIGPRGEIYDE